MESGLRVKHIYIYKHSSIVHSTVARAMLRMQALAPEKGKISVYCGIACLLSCGLGNFKRNVLAFWCLRVLLRGIPTNQSIHTGPLAQPFSQQRPYSIESYCWFSQGLYSGLVWYTQLISETTLGWFDTHLTYLRVFTLDWFWVTES